MAVTDFHSANSTSLIHVLGTPFRAIGRFFVSMMENDARVKQVEALQAMSDAELATRGLTRDTIIHHVFRAHMHI